MNHNRVVSGMRPTGRLHLGHYHGVLKNWIELQHRWDCFFFVADWHALTTDYQNSELIAEYTREMIIDWLASGLSPQSCTMFVQSRVPEHAELHVLLSMVTPLSWLERVPSYKDTIKKLNDRDLNTYGFLGYPLLQAADILLYQADTVPVGADQVAHVELTREIARTFNFAFGRGDDWEDLAFRALSRLPKKLKQKYIEARTQFIEQGLTDNIARLQEQLKDQHYLTEDETERLLGYLEGVGRMILSEPQAMLTDKPALPGLDGEKMSKSYNNVIYLREESGQVEHKIRKMQTDPARVRRSDPGDPKKCPVYALHKVYSDSSTLDWVNAGCRSARIGCLECKGPLIDSIDKEQDQFKERAAQYVEEPTVISHIISEGSEAARVAAKETLGEVRSAIGIGRR
ncbi:MAG: tryptophan--tRNA ligase [Gammaproteobacteria bacterium]|nr:tryptophan--tRNA ligase [Gammaproteobacteria bacterium]